MLNVRRKLLLATLVLGINVSVITGPVFAGDSVDNNIQPRISQSKPYTIPGGKGTLTSNTWRGNQVTSGSTYQWDYQVSAKYSGNKTVETIETRWTTSASLRNSASLNIGVSSGGIVSAGASSSWQTKSITHYFKNTKTQKEASYRSNTIVTPSRDYRAGTISVVNAASVKLAGDAKTYRINSGV